MSQEIRERIREAGLKQWEVALELGITETTFIRWLRGTPTKEHVESILAAIEKLSRKD